MKTKCIAVLILLSFISFGCQVDINPTRCEINVKQGSASIQNGTGYFNFGNIPFNFSQSITFTIENTGTDNLELNGVQKVQLTGTDIGDFMVSSNITKKIIQPNSSTTFSVNFFPKSIGDKTAIIYISNNDRDENPYTFVIVGTCTAPAPEIHVKQDSTDIISITGTFDFGYVKLNESSETVYFTIENNGNKNLELTSKINVLGNDASMFIVDQFKTNSIISPGNSTKFKVTFSPTDAGIKTAKISILNTDSDENPYTFTLYGTGVAAPEINLKWNSIDLSNYIWEHDFGSIVIKETSPELVITIENIGTATLQLTNSKDLIEISGSAPDMFAVSKTPDEFIPKGGSSTFSLVFSPTSKGLKTATISIANNDDDENPFIFKLKGTCVQPEIYLRQGSVNIPNTTGSYDFGSIYLGGSSDAKAFFIENHGSGDLKLTGTEKISVTGTDASMFAVDDSETSSSISESSSTSFKVTFTPTSAGNKTATISIASNDYDDNPFTFTIKGECQIPQPDMHVRRSPTDLPCNTGIYSFGTRQIGFNNGYLAFEIQNLGTGDLFLNGSPLVSVTGADAQMFPVSYSGTQTTIHQGNNTHFGISFSPTSVGKKSATISIANNDSDENPYVFTVTGFGIPAAPEIRIKRGYTEIYSGSSTYNFGDVKYGSPGNPLTFTIENLGWADLVLTGSPKIEVTGTDSSLFIVNESMTSTPVIAQGSTTFTISFSPLNMGVKTASVSISNNDSDENPFTFTVTGTGIFNDSPGYAFGWIGGGTDGWKQTTAPSAGASDLKSFDEPNGVATDSYGYIYVADSENHRVCKYNSNGEIIAWIGGGSDGWKTTGTASSGFSYQHFNSPRGICVDSFGNIYVTDSWLQRVSKWDSNGNALGCIGNGKNGWQKSIIPFGSGRDYQSFSSPTSVRLDSSRNLYIADSSNYRISKWYSNGNAAGWIGGGYDGWQTSYAPATGSTSYKAFGRPIGLYLDSYTIYVCDAGYDRICKWSSSGVSQGWIGGGYDGWQTSSNVSWGTDYKRFKTPLSVYLHSGYIYVADYQNFRVSKWSTSGTAVGWIGGGSDGWQTGAAPSSYGTDYRSFYTPCYICYGSGYLLIADYKNHRVAKWRY